MREKRRFYFTIIFVLVLAFFSANLSYPKIFNQGADFLKSKIHLGIPHFWQVPFRLGLDLRGGTQLIYEADLSKIEEAERAKKMEELKDVIERRINIYGVAEPVIQIQGKNRLIVELAGIKDIKEAINMIGETPYLEFRERFSEEEKQEAIKNIPEEEISGLIEQAKQQTGRELSREEVLEIITARLFKTTELTGEYLKSAEVTFDQDTGKIQIQLQFTKEGVKLFEQITERNVGKPLAIYLDGMSIIDTDGDDKITSADLYAPIVQEKIAGGRAVITGEMDITKAKQITQRLNSGALPVKIGEPISQRTIGPILGKTSLEKSLKAGIVGFFAVILFMIIFYRLPGVISSVALGIYIVLLLTLLKLIPVTLTLAGIAGFLLSIGMAVDANILIFARMREEIAQGKTFSGVVEEGFKRAWPSIRDSNFNSLIVCAILFGFATSFIKGFALTLGLGVLLSMFSAIFITRTFLECFVGTRFEKWEWLWR